MSDEQRRFDDLMKRVIKVTPQELKKRLSKTKNVKDTPKKNLKSDSKHADTA